MNSLYLQIKRTAFGQGFYTVFFTVVTIVLLILFPLFSKWLFVSYIDYYSSRSTKLIWQQNVLCMLKAVREREIAVFLLVPLINFIFAGLIVIHQMDLHVYPVA